MSLLLSFLAFLSCCFSGRKRRITARCSVFSAIRIGGTSLGFMPRTLATYCGPKLSLSFLSRSRLRSITLSWFSARYCAAFLRALSGSFQYRARSNCRIFDFLACRLSFCFASNLAAFFSRHALAAARSLSRRALRISAWQCLHALCVPVLARASAAYSVSGFTSPHRVHAFVPSFTTPNPLM